MFRRKYSLDTLRDTATVDFGWANCFCWLKRSLSNLVSVKFLSVKCKFAWIAEKFTSIGSFNIKLLKICLFQFTSHLIHIQQKWDQLLMNVSEITTLFLPPMGCVKSLILSEAAIKRCSTKQELPSSKSCKVAVFQSLITSEFLDPLLAFTYRKNDGYFNFWMKILERFFVNDKQILTECCESFLTLWDLVITIAHTHLNKPTAKNLCLSIYDLSPPPGLKGLRCFSAWCKFLDNFIEIWIKCRLDEKQKGVPISSCTSKEATLMYFE